MSTSIQLLYLRFERSHNGEFPLLDLPDERSWEIRESVDPKASADVCIHFANHGLTWFVNIKSTVSFFRILFPLGA